MKSTASVTEYVYDAEGRRVAKGSLPSWPTACVAPTSANGFTLTASYVLGLGGEQVSELNGSGTWQHTNIFANGKLLATYHDSDTYFAFTDWLGSKRAEYTPDAKFSTFSSLPYGDGLSSSGNAVDATEHHYTGKERDAESGNDYFNARYYGSSMGRFLSPDPFGGHLEYPQSLNKYAYVMNNPLRYTDPTGMDLQEVCTGKGSTTCGKSHWWNHERHVGTTDAKGHFHVTHFQTDANGNLAGHNINFNTSGIHIDGNKGEFIAGTDPTRVNGETGTPWADTHFVANSNCGGTCEAGGALFGSAQTLQNLATQQLIGPNKGLDALGQHPGDQYRGGNIEGPDMHLSLLPGSNVDPMHFDNRYPYGGVSGYMDHAAGWLDPAGHVETPLPQDITPVPQP